MKPIENGFDISFATVDQDRMSGRPVLAGTRFPLSQMLGELAEGRSVGELCETFSLDPEPVEAFLWYLATCFDKPVAVDFSVTENHPEETDYHRGRREEQERVTEWLLERKEFLVNEQRFVDSHTLRELHLQYVRMCKTKEKS